MMLLKWFALVGFFSASGSKTTYLPNLPVGEYRMVYDKTYPCEPTKNHTLQFNLYFSKRTSTITEVKGNLTLLVPFDDSFNLDVNFASWSLTGGWKPNAIVYLSKNGCNQLKTVLGKAWTAISKSFNFSYNCPVPAGTYVTQGVNLKELQEHGLPKVFFYGKYRATFRLKNKKITAGCGVVELAMVRPWEQPI